MNGRNTMLHHFRVRNYLRNKEIFGEDSKFITVYGENYV